MDLQKLMEDYKQYNKYEETKEIVEKWDKTGILQGLDSEIERHTMATLIENQAKRLIDETSRTQTTANKESWSDIALPLVRRTFGKVVAQDLMSVQPMSMPSGLVFWLDFKFGTDKPTNESIYTDGDIIHGDVTSSADISGNVYDWDYSFTKNYVSASSVTCAMTSASFSDFNYSSDLSSSFAANGDHYRKVTVAKSELSNLDADACSAFTVDSPAVDITYRDYTKFDATNVYFYVSGSHTGSLDNVEYVKATTPTDRGDFEAGQTGVGDIPEFNIDMRQKSISPETRKLKAQWTPEIAQDLSAYHSVDAEAELTNVMSDYMALEIDMELINMIYHNVLIEEFWSAKINKFVDSDGAYISNAGTFTGTQQEWYQTLIQKIRKVSNAIHKRTLLGGANWLIVGTDVATILESMHSGFISFKGDEGFVKYNLGIEKIGSLANEFDVYKNPYFRNDTILLGFRGGSFLQTGAVYAPYIPIMATPTVLDPDDFTPRKAIYTRSAKELVRPQFYGKITCRDLNVI